MMETRKFAMVIVVTCIFLAACSPDPKQMVDTKPVGDGLTFLGFAGVLAALIVVFGKFISDSKVTAYSSHVMAGLFVLLALVVAVAAIPSLIIPITIAAAVLVILAVVSIRWK